MTRIQFDLSTPLGRQANAERTYQEHRALLRNQTPCWQFNCDALRRRRSTFAAYTKREDPR